MQVLNPVAIAASTFVSSTLAEADYSAWAAGTAYTVGQRVIRTSTHRIYERLVAGTTTTAPESDPDNWVDVGPTNRWAMFDSDLTTISAGSSSISIVIAAGSLVTGVVLLGVVGTQVQVLAGATVVNTTAVPAPVSPAVSRTVVITGLSIAAGTNTTITVTGTGTLKVSHLTLGAWVDLGGTLPGTQVGITDYSKKVTDQFGVASVTKRNYSRKLQGSMSVLASDVQRVADVMASLRGTVCYWSFADAYESLQALGLYQDFGLVVSGAGRCTYSLTVEGLAADDAVVVPGASVATVPGVSGFGYTVKAGGLAFAWTGVAGYQAEIRLGTSWSSAALLWAGDASTWFWPWPANGTYTVLIKFRDAGTGTSYSAAAVPLTVVVDAAMQIQLSQVVGGPDLLARLYTRPNLLANGGFERGYVNWSSPVSGFTIQDTGWGWGRALIHYSPPNGTSYVLSDAFTVSAGNTYVVTGDSVLFATSGQVYFDLQFYDGAMAPVAGGDGPQNPIGTHNFADDDANRTATAVAVAAPAGSVYAKARFVWSGITSCTALGVRQVKVEQGGLPATPYSAETGLVGAFADATTAASAASAAQTSANTANTALANIASDSILSPSEKPSVAQDYSVITAEQSGIDTQATAYGITTEKTAYDNAVSALTTYLGTLTGWNTIPGSDVTIVGSTFRGKFADVYTTRQTLLNKIAANAKALADAAQSTANTANTAAGAAQTSANTANTELASIASDNVLSKDEKPSVILDWTNISNEQSGIDAQATAYGISTEKTTYDSAISTLSGYLTGLSPSWSDTTQHTTIVGTTFRSNFAAVYTARQALLNKIADIANSKLATRINLLPNGGFEYGSTGWSLTAQGLTAQDGVWGRVAGRYTAFSGTADSYTDEFVVQSGAVYTITGDSMLFATSGVIWFDLLWYDSGHTYISTLTGASTGPHDFSASDSNRNAHAVSGTAPAGAAYARARFVYNSVVGGTAVGCRQIKVERGGLPATKYTNDTALVAAFGAATAAKNAADAAQSSANTANTEISNISSDNVLSRVEKAAVILDWTNISNEQAGIDAQADLYQVSRSTYDSAISALSSYLSGLSPSWSDTAQNTTIVGSAFRSNFAAVYTARQVVLNAISAAAAAKVATRPNLLVNGGFERGYTNWSAVAGFVAADDVWGRVLWSFTTASGTGSITSDTFQVSAGAVYTITADTLMFATSGAVYLDLLFYDGPGGTLLLDGPQNPISAPHNFSVDDSNRNVHAVSATAPPGATVAYARFVWQSLVGCTALGVRQVKVEQGGLPATPYTAETAVTNIATGQIGANAATAPYYLYTDLGGATHSTGYRWRASFNITPPVNCIAEVEATLDGDATGYDSGRYFGVGIDPATSGSSIPSGSLVAGSTFGSSSGRTNVSLRSQFTLTAGTNYDIGVFSRNLVASSSSCAMWGVTLTVNLLKR